MERHPLYGVIVKEKSWVPAPRFLLRRDRIFRAIEGMPPGRVLEVGCGAGTLLSDLQEQGFHCEALEYSPQALELARYVHRESPQVRIHSEPQPGWEGAFDYVFAFEVLEHVEDDERTFAQWYSWLRPGGTMLVSVPAHQKRFNAVDRRAGHFRRYDRADLLQLVERSGLEKPNLECYGFPLADVIEGVKALTYRRQMPPDETELARNTDKSGTERTIEMKLFPFQRSYIGMLMMRIFFQVQRLFLKTELGGCYLLKANRPSA